MAASVSSRNREQTAVNYFIAFSLIATVVYEPIR